jgi:hypothetical protein
MIKKRNAVNYNVDENGLNFNYIGCQLSSNRNSDIQNKLQRFNYMCGTVKHTLLHKSRQETILKFCELLAVQSLLCGSKRYTLTEKHSQ